jgi:hypothetical protein
MIMPRFDKTGPQGMGPRTGKGLGQCISSSNKKQSLADRKQELEKELNNIKKEEAELIQEK